MNQVNWVIVGNPQVMDVEMSCDRLPLTMYCKATVCYGSDTSSTYNNNGYLLRGVRSKILALQQEKMRTPFQHVDLFVMIHNKYVRLHAHYYVHAHILIKIFYNERWSIRLNMAFMLLSNPAKFFKFIKETASHIVVCFLLYNSYPTFYFLCKFISNVLLLYFR